MAAKMVAITVFIVNTIWKKNKNLKTIITDEYKLQLISNSGHFLFKIISELKLKDNRQQINQNLRIDDLF